VMVYQQQHVISIMIASVQILVLEYFLLTYRRQ